MLSTPRIVSSLKMMESTASVLGAALPLEAGHHDAALAHGDGDGVIQRLGRVRRRVDHDLGAAARRLAHARHHVVLLDVDGDVGAQLSREGELLRVAREPGDHDLAAPRRARR